MCLVVKAVLLEIVCDCTSAAFLAAFRRFVSRRGPVSKVISDNGTTFKAADAELRQLFQEVSSVSQQVAEAVANLGVEWTYIPPRAPNFERIWEANVKSFKHHFKRVVGDAKLTYEKFPTIA